VTPVRLFELVLLLLAVIIGLELLARRLRLPPAAAFILGGVGLALIPGTPDVQPDPDLVLVLFLPPLLLASAYFTVWRDFRANLYIILELAVGAVAFTTLIVGLVAHWMVPGLPWAACFALGAIVSPPDAVAAKAVLEHVRLPPRMVVLLEGESLVNDASGLVLFRFAVAAALTGTFDAGQAAVTFGVVAIGGVAAGALLGFVTSLLLKRLPDPLLNILVSFLVGWTSYIGADALGVSGVLSTVACGLVMGWRQHDILSAVTRLHARAVWDLAVFVLEALVFILIGLSLRGVLQRLGGDWGGLESVAPAAGAIVAAVVLTRFAWIFPAVYMLGAVFPGWRRRRPFPPVAVPIVMSWAGMRGVVSLAAALSLPESFPGRDFILATTFAVILVTVLVQGATLAPLIRLLRLNGFVMPEGDTLSEAAARIDVATAQLAVIEERGIAPDGTLRHPRLVEQYRFRLAAVTRFRDANGALLPDRNAHFGLVLSALEAGRTELLRLHRTGAIHDSVLRALEQELDLEEVTARGHHSEES
jgi:monovalent cation/hydrogen antiporter